MDQAGIIACFAGTPVALKPGEETLEVSDEFSGSLVPLAAHGYIVCIQEQRMLLLKGEIVLCNDLPEIGRRKMIKVTGNVQCIPVSVSYTHLTLPTNREV